jgi:hypothetical protein
MAVESPLKSIDDLLEQITERLGTASGPSVREIDELMGVLERDSPDPKLRQGLKRVRQSQELTEGKARRLRDKFFADYKQKQAKAMSAIAAGTNDPKDLMAIFEFKNAQEANEEMRNIFLDELTDAGMTPERSRQVADELAEEYKDIFTKDEMAQAFEEGKTGVGKDAPRRMSLEKAALVESGQLSKERAAMRMPAGTAESKDNLTGDPDALRESKIARGDKPSKKAGPLRPLFEPRTRPEEARFYKAGAGTNIQVDVRPKDPKVAPYMVSAKQSSRFPGMMEITRTATDEKGVSFRKATQASTLNEAFEDVITRGGDVSKGFKKDQVAHFGKIFGLTPDELKGIAGDKGRTGIKPLLIPVEQFFGPVTKGTGAGRVTGLGAFGALGGERPGAVRNFLGDEITPEMLKDPKFLERKLKTAKGMQQFAALSPAKRAMALGGMATIDDVRQAIAKRQGFSRVQPTSNNRPAMRQLRASLQELERAKAAKSLPKKASLKVQSPKSYKKRPGRKFRATKLPGGNPLLNLAMRAVQELRGGL